MLRFSAAARNASGILDGHTARLTMTGLLLPAEGLDAIAVSACDLSLDRSREGTGERL
jgi:hypothetical protein